MNKKLKAEWVGIEDCKINGYHKKYTIPKRFFDRNGFVYQLDRANSAYLDLMKMYSDHWFMLCNKNQDKIISVASPYGSLLEKLQEVTEYAVKHDLKAILLNRTWYVNKQTCTIIFVKPDVDIYICGTKKNDFCDSEGVEMIEISRKTGLEGEIKWLTRNT